MGVSILSLSENCNTPWVDYKKQLYYDHLPSYYSSAWDPVKNTISSDEPDNSEQGLYLGGLTKFGEKVVRELNRVGILVDASGVSLEGVMKVLDVSCTSVQRSPTTNGHFITD